MRVLAAAMLAAFSIILPGGNSAGAADPASGRAEIAGPGLITVEGETFRLWGVLMPGRATREGMIAYDQFAGLIEGRLLTCVPTDSSPANVSDAICRTGQGGDIAELLVREGWALDDGPRSRGYYLDEMEEASARRRGIWGLAPEGSVLIESGAERPGPPAEDPQGIEDRPEEPAPESVAEPESAPVVPEELPVANEPAPQPQVAVTPPDPPPAVEAPVARPPMAWIQIAGGRSAAQMAAELARMRSAYPWLLEGRETRFLGPGDGSGARHRVLLALGLEEIGDVCARLSASREACLLVDLR